MISPQDNDKEHQNSLGVEQQVPSEAQDDHSRSQIDQSESYPEPLEEDRVVITPIAQEPNHNPHSLRKMPTQEESSAYALAQRLSNISLIAAAVSLFIGGVPLSLLALIVGIVAYRKIQLSSKDDQSVLKAQWEQSLRLVRIAIIMAGVGIIINAISTFYLFSILGSAGYGNFLTGSSGQALSGSISVWG